MKKNHLMRLVIVVAVIFVFSGGKGFSQMAGMHDHQQMDHSRHMQMTQPREIIVDLETVPAELKTGSPSKITFMIKDGEGEPVKDLVITHDRLVHVIIASADFSVFAHIHPDDFSPITDEMKKKAEYPVVFTFPKAGQYIIAIDSAVKDMLISEHFTLDVGGEPQMGVYKKDLSREKKFGDLTVTLSTTPDELVAGKEALLKYIFKKGSGPVTDLEPYLSAPMHVAIISPDLNNFMHVHGELPGASMGHDHMGQMMHMMHMEVPKKFGPEIDVPAIFPAKGLYQIFSEVKHDGKVVVISFMVEVK